MVALTVEIRFRGHADGETKLYLPDSWAEQRELWREIRAFTVKGAVIEDAAATEPASALRLLRHKPRAAITIRYDITQGSGGDPRGQDGIPARPVVRPNWFFAVGNEIFAFPETESANPLPRPPARFAWGRLPAGWHVGSDLDHGRMGRALTIDDIAASTMLGGSDVRLVERNVGTGRFRVAVRGSFLFTDDQLADAIAGIVGTERRFWGDPPAPYFVSLVPLIPGGGVVQRGGTGRGDGFALYLSPEVELKQIMSLLAHEAEHSWLPNRTGGAPNERNEAHFWFGEGFSDYYGTRTLLDAGVFSPADYVGWWNAVFVRQASSPVRNAPNERILEAYWTNQDVRQLPYDRGAIFAAYADALARSATGNRNSIDDVVRRMKVLAATDSRPAIELFPVAFRDVTGLDIADRIERFITRGEDIPLPGDAIGACAEVRTLRMARFDRGFDVAATLANNRTFTGVNRAHPAYAAGLRDGMRLVRRDGGRTGDSRVPISYVVKDGEVEKSIRYLPAGKEQIEVLEAVLKPHRDGTSALSCRGPS
jgi:predicted metalloprotease with PDZ domain